MSSTNMHPRRRPASPSVTPSLLDCFQNMSIRKGDTFHVPHKHDQDLWDPLAKESKSTTPSMPARSTTCPQSLEDLLIGSGERRAVDLLHRVDEAIANRKFSPSQLWTLPAPVSLVAVVLPTVALAPQSLNPNLASVPRLVRPPCRCNT